MGNFDFINNEKLKKQIEFAVTVDEMKNILRRPQAMKKGSTQ